MFDLFDELSELFYVSDRDSYELIFMNKASRERFGVQATAGLKCHKVIYGKDAPCEFCSAPHLTRAAFYTWECPGCVDGRHYLVKDKLMDWQGKEVHVCLAFDMTEAEERRKYLKNALDAETLVMDCVKLLHTTQNLPYVLDKILEKIGRFLEAQRAYLFEIQGDLMSNTHEWCAPGVAPQMENLQNLPVPVDGQLKDVSAVKCLLIDNVDKTRDSHPQEYKTFREQGIQRLVAVPLELDGRLLGYIGVDNPPAEKIENISSLLGTLGYFLSSSLRRQDDKRLLDTLNFYDPLTGAMNRNAFIRDVEAFMVLPESVGVLCIDINGMKDINDERGHPYGDQVLVKTAETLTSLFGPGALYRTGGDEFVVICRSIGEADLEERVRALRGLLTETVECHASIGCQWAQECSGLQRILFEADEIMYADKKQYYHGRAGSRYRHGNDDILGLTKPGALEQMLLDGRFLVYFQPKVSVYTGKRIGAEALIRFQIPGDTVMAPNQFIPILEQAHLISLIDFYVFEQVCANLARWRGSGLPVMPVSVNFSRYSLTEKQFEARLLDIWRKYGIPQELLEIEVTESVEADDSYNFLRIIRQIRDAGFSVSIDDFGVKHANLSLFTSMDFDVLKIDRSLTSDLPRNPKARAIMQSVADICRKMGIRIVAEGVETEEQLAILKDIDCGGAQGYLFSRPLPVDEFEQKYLRRNDYN